MVMVKKQQTGSTGNSALQKGSHLFFFFLSVERGDGLEMALPYQRRII